MCQVLKVHRSGYYAWLQRPISKRQQENEHFKKKIQVIYKESKQRYGSPKIAKELKAQGIQVSRPRVARLMRQEGLQSNIQKQYKVATTDSKHTYAVAPNYLNRNFRAEKPGQKWVSDITYIPTQKGWLYVTTIIDLYDRKVIGWALSDNMTAEDTTIAAWQRAIQNRSYETGLLLHSDRGVQYACERFRSLFEGTTIVQSMSRKGNCWDNAVAENFFKILKSELIQHCSFETIAGAKLEVFEFIESWYNRKRRHSYLGYLTPEEFSNLFYQNAA